MSCITGRQLHRKPLARLALVAAFISMLSLTAGTAAFAASPQQREAKSKKETVLVAGLLPLTGSSAQLAEQMQETMQIGIDEANKDKGLKCALELRTYDTKRSAETAATEAQRAISSDKAIALLGPYDTTEALAVVPVADRNQTVEIQISSSDPRPTQQSPYNFRTTYLSADSTRALVEIPKTLGKKKLAVIYAAGSFNQGTLPLIDKNATEFGLKVLDKVEFPANATDVSAQVAKAKASNPDFVIISAGSSGDNGLVLKTMDEQGWHVPVAGFSPIESSDAYAIGGAAYDNMPAIYRTGVADFTKPEYKALVRKYNKATGDGEKTIPDVAVTAYDGVKLLTEGLRASNCTGGQDLVTAIQDLPPLMLAGGKAGVKAEYSAGKHDPYTGNYVSIYNVKGRKAKYDPKVQPRG